MRIDGAVLARWRSLDVATAVAAIADHAKRDQTFKPVKDATTSRWHVTVDGNEFELLLLGLRGTACLDMDEAPAAKQQILVSRSFGKGVTDVAGIVEAVQGGGEAAASGQRGQCGQRVLHDQPLPVERPPAQRQRDGATAAADGRFTAAGGNGG